ncbi:MAG: hypothetical protein RSD04_05265, partial [Clostridia bacterium]
MNENIAKALYRKAVGYTAKEIVEEYGGESGELLKRKVSKKHIPPDMTALKTFIELDKSRGDIANMSDEELLRSAGLYGTDVATGESGYNLAAI